MSTTEKLVETKGGGARVTMESVRRQVLSYGNQIHEYLNNLEADIDGYKFSVEKHGEALTVDISFRATIHPNTGSHIPK